MAFQFLLCSFVGAMYDRPTPTACPQHISLKNNTIHKAPKGAKEGQLSSAVSYKVASEDGGSKGIRLLAIKRQCHEDTDLMLENPHQQPPF